MEERIHNNNHFFNNKFYYFFDINKRYGGNKKPSKFICLVLKMLQIQPEKEIVVEFIKNEEFRY